MPNRGIPSLPDIDLAWYAAIPTRVSRRRFDGGSLSTGESFRLRTLCERLSAQADKVRAVLVDGAHHSVFTGLVGGYGRIDGAPSFVAFIGHEDSDIDVGFVGEAVILHATSDGLDTCWNAGMFDAERTAALIELGASESVRAVTPVGHAIVRMRGTERLMRRYVHADSRLDLEQVAPGSATWPVWALEAAEAVRLAPSGGNGQPWRLRMDGDTLVLACKPEKRYWTWRFDCGIAMLHAELGAAHAGVRGGWERMSDLDVARFMPENRP